MKEKISLEEATMKALLGELDNSKDDVEGIVDGIMVVTDPDITPEEYEEVIERAEEIIEDTPEGEIPFNDEYIGEYLLTCPICGSSFINKEILNVGDSCPICTEVPAQGFILNGQVATQEDVELQNNIKSNEDEELNDETFEEPIENNEEEPISEEDVEETKEEIVASEVIKKSDNKLEEKIEEVIARDKILDELEESKNLSEARSHKEDNERVAPRGEINKVQGYIKDPTGEYSEIDIPKRAVFHQSKPDKNGRIWGFYDKDEVDTYEYSTDDIEDFKELRGNAEEERIHSKYHKRLAKEYDDEASDIIRKRKLDRARRTLKGKNIFDVKEESRDCNEWIDLEESLILNDYDDIITSIDNADSIEEIQDILYEKTDDALEDELQFMLDTCIDNGDDLYSIKSTLVEIVENNKNAE